MSGPSFLGLGSEADDADDQERYRGEDLYRANWGARVAFALIVLAIVAGLGYMQWRNDHSMWGIFPKPASTQANSSAQSNAASAASAQASAAPAGSATPSQPSGATENATNAGSAPSAPAAGNPANNSTATSASSDSTPPASTNDTTEAKRVPAPQPNSAPAAAAKAPDETAAAKEPSVAATKPLQPAGSSAKKSAETTPKSSLAADQAGATPADSDAADGSSVSENANTESAPVPAKSTRKPATAPREVSDEPVKLASIYLEGKGVPQNCDEGVGILRAADGRGNARATIKLGALYATGECVPLDRVIAYHYFSRAHSSDPSNEWVEQNRAMLWTSMSDEERARARDLDGEITQR